MSFHGKPQENSKQIYKSSRNRTNKRNLSLTRTTLSKVSSTSNALMIFSLPFLENPITSALRIIYPPIKLNTTIFLKAKEMSTVPEPALL